MRITEWLFVQHEEFRRALRKIELAQHDPGPTGSGKVRQILKRLLPALRVHETVEDELLAPLLKREIKGIEPELQRLFKDGHHELHETLARLQAVMGLGSAPISQFVAAVNFGDLLRRHMKQEERTLFPIVEKSLSAALQAELGEQAERLAAAPEAGRRP